MVKIVRTVRISFFFGGEGDSEESFGKWLQHLSDLKNLNIYLKRESLKGGGYNKLLEKAIRHRKKCSQKFSQSFLMVNSDRSDRGDCSGDYSLKQLRQEAARHNFEVCTLTPNIEGLFLRMVLNKKNKSIKEASLNSPSEVKRLIKSYWEDYKKPADFLTLSQKFSMADLENAALSYKDLHNLLIKIGLVSK